MMHTRRLCALKPATILVTSCLIVAQSVGGSTTKLLAVLWDHLFHEKTEELFFRGEIAHSYAMNGKKVSSTSVNFPPFPVYAVMEDFFMPTDNRIPFSEANAETDAAINEIAMLFAHGIVRLAKSNLLNSMKISEENSVKSLDSLRNSCMYVSTATEHK